MSMNNLKLTNLIIISDIKYHYSISENYMELI